MAVSLGGSLFGISGMLFFIPLTSSCYALLRESVNSRNARNGVPAVRKKEADAETGSGKLPGSVEEKKMEKKNPAGRNTGKKMGKKL